MDALTITAISKELAKQAKKVRDDLAVGEHVIEGDITLSYNGVVKVCEDESYTPTTAIPLKTALALFLRYSGVTGPAANTALIKAMTEALEIERLTGKAKKDAVEAIREVADLDAAEEAVRQGLAELPEATRKGKVNAKVKVEVKEKAALEEAA